MRKVFFCLFAVASLTAAICSCKKCYTCAYSAVASDIYCAKNTPKSILTQLDTSCVQAGGVWSIYQQ